MVGVYGAGVYAEDMPTISVYLSVWVCWSVIYIAAACGAIFNMLEFIVDAIGSMLG